MPCFSYIQVDVDSLEALAARYEISCMPTFLFIKNQKEVVQRLEGANADKIAEIVRANK